MASGFTTLPQFHGQAPWGKWNRPIHLLLVQVAMTNPENKISTKTS
jgi:hypothetical protein